MSTRSVVARKSTDPKKVYQGVYCHWDGYPTARGAKIWEIVYKDFIGNKGKIGVQNDGELKTALEGFCKIYIDGHKGGWSAFGKECYCHTPEFVMRDGVRDCIVTGDTNSPLFHEYVYIIDPETATMQILAMKDFGKEYPSQGGKDEKVLATNEWGNIVDYGHCVYGHVLIATVSFRDAFEPDWEAIEAINVNE